MSIVPYILSSAPFITFSIFAIWISKARYNIQPKLSTLCIVLFSAFLLIHILNALLMDEEFLLAHEFGYTLYPLAMFYKAMLPFITMGLEAAILLSAFLWRKQNGAHYKEPALLIFVVIGSVFLVNALRFATQSAIAHDITLTFEEMIEFQYIITFFFSCLYASIYLCLLFAIYGWRGDNFNNELLYMLTLKVDPDNKKDDIEAGVFETIDYVPFLAGLFMFGGLLAIPLIWGGILDMSYYEALLPALISCVLFAYCHNRKGRFMWDRLFIVIAFVAYVIFKITVLKGGSNEPFFIAGGILGYPIMFGCGWIGIMLVRLAKRGVISLMHKKT